MRVWARGEHRGARRRVGIVRREVELDVENGALVERALWRAKITMPDEHRRIVHLTQCFHEYGQKNGETHGTEAYRARSNVRNGEALELLEVLHEAPCGRDVTARVRVR